MKQNAPRAAVAIGTVAIGAALFAVAFRYAIHWLYSAFGRHDVLELFESIPVPLRIVLPAVGGLAAGLVVRTRAGNVGEAPRRLSMRVALRKALGSFFAIATGGSVGREGPLVQFGGTLGDTVARFADLDPRTLVSAGTAAGFAAAYNTPLSAVLFVIEVTNDHGLTAPGEPQKWAGNRAVAVLFATALSTLVVRAIAGEGPLYGERAFVTTSSVELFAFAGLAIVTAFAAQALIRLLAVGDQAFQKIPQPARAAFGGLLVGALACTLPAVTGNGYEPLGRLIDGKYAVPLVALVVIAKLFATTFSVSSGSPGGVFTPSLLVGGGVGFVFGHLLHASADGAYTLVGMAAMIAATTHAPLMASVFVFEVTGDYALVLPLVVTTALSTLVARRLSPDSIYAAEAKRA